MIYSKNTNPTIECTLIYPQVVPVHRNSITIKHRKTAQFIGQWTISTRPKSNLKNSKKHEEVKRTGTGIFTSSKKPLRTLMDTKLTTIEQNVQVVRKIGQFLYGQKVCKFQ